MSYRLYHERFLSETNQYQAHIKTPTAYQKERLWPLWCESEYAYQVVQNKTQQELEQRYATSEHGYTTTTRRSGYEVQFLFTHRMCNPKLCFIYHTL